MQKSKLQFKIQNFGYSLIEVIIALALVVVTITIFGVAVSSTPLTKTARNQNLAYHIASKKIEELRDTAFDSLPASGAFADSGLAALASPTANLTVADYEGSSEIKKITVVISWDEAGSTRNVTLETLISNTGLNL
jgi:type II secretory pathway pseudopilin PulG